MSYWLTDPELFLYAKGPDDVILRRCKKLASSSSSGSSLVVPMKSDDFDYVSNVENHLELIEDMFEWDETDYKRLVKYIFERHLLVNSQGFVIAELYTVDKDGNKMIDDANEEVPAIYIRSLDVLALKPYIPKLRERPIPLRTVKYLGDVNGKAAMMEEDSNVTKLTATVENLEAENTRLESQLTKLTARVENLETENTRLESKNNTLETRVTQLTANTKEVWLNDLTNIAWVGIEGLRSNPTGTFSNINIVDQQGTFTVDDGSTNIQARYWYKVEVFANSKSNGKFPAVVLEDLTPNKERARFSLQNWTSYKSTDGKTYAFRI